MRAASTVRRWITLTHRWLGVVFCVLFLQWFLSGMVMMYWRYPRVDPEDRLARAGALDPVTIHVTPRQALAALREAGAPSQLRLNLLDGRPIYRFAFGGFTKLVFADDGQVLEAIPPLMALRIAAVWADYPAARVLSQELLTKPNQWTIDPSVMRYGPFWKNEWPNGEEIYVSQSTGEVVQATTRASRIGAYFGAIPHWLYFMPLLRSAVWSGVVIWLSAAGTVMSMLGLAAGVWLYSPSNQFRTGSGKSSVPFSGAKHWHVILGLLFGAVTCTWVFSGMLSMGPFAWLSDRDLPNLAKALRGDHVDVDKFDRRDPGAAIADAAASALRVKELEFGSFNGAAIYLAWESPRKSRVIPITSRSEEAFNIEAILNAVNSATPVKIAETRLVEQYEAYYMDRDKRKPLPVLYVQLDDPGRSSYYIDPRSAKVVESYGVRTRWERWLHHGLHSIDFPWLYGRRPAWHIFVLALLLGCTVLSITSLLIAWKLVRRKILR